MGKCKRCNKIVSKKAPGLECQRCGVIVHANTICTELSNKQINLLKSADNLEWTCNECKQKSPFRKSSFVVPEEEAEDDDDAGSNREDTVPINSSKFLSSISAEIEKSIKRELRETNQCIQYLSDKVDDYLEMMETFKEKIKDLESKNSDLINKNKNLNLKVDALEQRMNEMQQKQLNKTLEITGIPPFKGDNLKETLKLVAKKLNTNEEEINKITRIHTKQGKPEIVYIKMKDELTMSKWLAAARLKHLTLIDVVPNIEPSKSKNKIYIRQALTQHSKYLLWKAKQTLKDSFKFIWCKEGKVLVRKTEESKIITLRNDSDIAKLLHIPKKN